MMMMVVCIRLLLLLTLFAALPFHHSCHAFSLRRSLLFKRRGPMVQHIPIVTTTTEQQMTATNIHTASSISNVNRGVINGASPPVSELNPLQSTLTKMGMMMFIAGMCLSLPLALLVPFVLHKIGIYDRIEKEKKALRAGHVCARTLTKIIPFMNVQVEGTSPEHPEPSVWVCNHSSMLDVFVMLANDHKLRGPNRRPIKIVYVSACGVFLLLVCNVCVGVILSNLFRLSLVKCLILHSGNNWKTIPLPNYSFINADSFLCKWPTMVMGRKMTMIVAPFDHSSKIPNEPLQKALM